MIICLKCGQTFKGDFEEVPVHECFPADGFCSCTVGDKPGTSIAFRKHDGIYICERCNKPLHPVVKIYGSPVDHPDHYCRGGFECLDVIEALGLGFLAGNAFKYLWRFQFKGKPIEDLKKVRFYLDRLIKKEEKNAGL